jgi:NADPH:quinone reductase-like Zn-dependent oxidoreductase
MVGSTSKGRWLGPLVRPLMAMFLSPFVSQQFKPMIAQLKASDMDRLRGLLAAGAVKPEIDRHFDLADVAAAVTYLETGRARGKVIIDVRRGDAAQ